MYEKIITNEQGGKQSDIGYAFDLIPPSAILAVARIFEHGAKKYEPWNWLKIPFTDHLNHALYHIFQHLNQDKKDDHLYHAGYRLLMAIETYHRIDWQVKKDAHY